MKTRRAKIGKKMRRPATRLTRQRMMRVTMMAREVAREEMEIGRLAVSEKGKLKIQMRKPLRTERGAVAVFSIGLRSRDWAALARRFSEEGSPGCVAKRARLRRVHPMALTHPRRCHRFDPTCKTASIVSDFVSWGKKKKGAKKQERGKKRSSGEKQGTKLSQREEGS